MGWFFKDKKNFISFTELLRDLPNRVYSSLLLQSLLARYWDETQREIIKKQFIPFICFTILSIIHFMTMLSDHSETEHPTTG